MSGEDSPSRNPGGAAPTGEPSPVSDDAIRERMRELTSSLLKTGRVDAEALKEVGQALTADLGGPPHTPSAPEAFADAVRRVDGALMHAAGAAHAALSALADKGDDFSDNDLKEALEQLKQVQQAYVEASARVAEAASGNVRRELEELVRHAQQVGTDAGAQVASMVNEFAHRLSSTSGDAARSGLDLTRHYGVRMAMLTSGVLAGVADALKQQSSTKTGE